LNIYEKKIIWKLALLFVAIGIGVSSLIYTGRLVNSLKVEESLKVEHWAESIRLVEVTDDVNVLNLLSSIIESNNSVPVILTDENGLILGHRNFDPVKSMDSDFMHGEYIRMRDRSEPIIISFGEGIQNYIYYSESIILTKLRYYPYIQLSIIIFFIAVAYFAFSMSRKSEQNQVWVGMSKETAHQLGTPTSSLEAWVEIIKERFPDDNIHGELSRDVARLEKITERFSSIGSRPELHPESIRQIIENSIDYLKSRSSSKVSYKINFLADKDLRVPLNISLFEWVLENLIKNAIDSMNGVGRISISVNESANSVVVDIQDSGKGMSKRSYKRIFKPGYSTKARGWGLGLSLSKRIVETYHHGKIFVKSSEIGKGSVFRIILNKQKLQK
jgi:signal transduction histidine kinase